MLAASGVMDLIVAGEGGDTMTYDGEEWKRRVTVVMGVVVGEG